MHPHRGTTASGKHSSCPCFLVRLTLSITVGVTFDNTPYSACSAATQQLPKSEPCMTPVQQVLQTHKPKVVISPHPVHAAWLAANDTSSSCPQTQCAGDTIAAPYSMTCLHCGIAGHSTTQCTCAQHSQFAHISYITLSGKQTDIQCHTDHCASAMLQPLHCK